LRALQVAIALVVGAIVIAIYLPIFRMGAVI
jgi:type II secretory pathway component PulF